MEFQRFTAPDAEALAANIAECRVKLADAHRTGQGVAVIEHSADLGSMLTTARLETQALSLMKEQLGLAETLPVDEATGWFWNAYATALQYTGQREEANHVFSKARDLCQAGGWSRLRSFVLHHWGRSLVEQDLLPEAERCFTEALKLRQQLNDPRQASTERALAGLAQLRGQSNP